MTKLLILAYDFPPYVSVGGLRPYSWYTYMHEFGVFPIVITRQWNNKYRNHLDYVASGESEETIREENKNGLILRTPYKPNLSNQLLLKYGDEKIWLIRKCITAFYEFGQFLFPIGSKVNLFLEADKFLESEKVDAIIATGDPFILFKYASILSKKYDIPWIADYRDSWVQEKNGRNKGYKVFDAFYERKYLKNVDKITTVSTFFQKLIEQNIGSKDFEIVINGYDPKIISETKDIKQNKGKLSIAINGTLQNWNPVESFLKVCNEIIEENSEFKIELNFFGINKEKEIKQILELKLPRLKECVNFHPKMNNIEYAKEIAKQNVFLLFNDYSILGTKIFDYLALKRKILFCYTKDKESDELKEKYFFFNEIETESKTLQADVISATNSGIVVENPQHLKKILLELNDECKENGFISCQSKNTEQYSRIKQVEKLAEIVKQISKR